MKLGKALREIGPGGAWRYGVGQVKLTLLRCLLLPPQLRTALLRLFGSRIGSGALIHPVTFSNLYRTGLKGFRCGRECFIGEECFLDMADSIILGDQVTLSARVTILTHINVGYRNHPLQRAFPARTAPVEIGSGGFVGAGAMILAGVKIGAEAFVAAGSVVNRDVLEGSVVAGVPAQVIRTVNNRH